MNKLSFLGLGGCWSFQTTQESGAGSRNSRVSQGVVRTLCWGPREYTCQEEDKLDSTGPLPSRELSCSRLSLRFPGAQGKMGFHVRTFKYRDGCKINLPPCLLDSELLGITGPRAPSMTGLLTSWEPSEGAGGRGGAAGGPGFSAGGAGRGWSGTGAERPAGGGRHVPIWPRGPAWGCGAEPDRAAVSPQRISCTSLRASVTSPTGRSGCGS